MNGVSKDVLEISFAVENGLAVRRILEEFERNPETVRFLAEFGLPRFVLQILEKREENGKLTRVHELNRPDSGKEGAVTGFIYRCLDLQNQLRPVCLSANVKSSVFFIT